MGRCKIYKITNGPQEHCTLPEGHKGPHTWEDDVEPTYAKYGYHGIIKNKTHFIVGEAGPERVNITPLKKTYHAKKNTFKFKNNLGFDPMDVLDW